MFLVLFTFWLSPVIRSSYPALTVFCGEPADWGEGGGEGCRGSRGSLKGAEQKQDTIPCVPDTCTSGAWKRGRSPVWEGTRRASGR